MGEDGIDKPLGCLGVLDNLAVADVELYLRERGSVIVDLLFEGERLHHRRATGAVVLSRASLLAVHVDGGREAACLFRASREVFDIAKFDLQCSSSGAERGKPQHNRRGRSSRITVVVRPSET